MCNKWKGTIRLVGLGNSLSFDIISPTLSLSFLTLLIPDGQRWHVDAWLAVVFDLFTQEKLFHDPAFDGFPTRLTRSCKTQRLSRKICSQLTWWQICLACRHEKSALCCHSCVAQNIINSCCCYLGWCDLQVLGFCATAGLLAWGKLAKNLPILRNKASSLR